MLKNKSVQAVIVSAALVALYSASLAPLKAARIADLKIMDSYFALDCALDPLPERAGEFVVAGIDDESLRRAGLQWPWSRGTVARIIDRISEHSPRAISADFVFAGKSADPKDDEALVAALKGRKNVFGAAFFGADGKYVMPEESIAVNMADFGFINKPRDADKSVRRMMPYIVSNSGELIDYSLSLKTASRLLNVPAINLAASVPCARDGTAYIDFRGRPDNFMFIPVWRVMEGVPSYLLKDKVVLLGVTSESFHDTYNTPLGMMPGLFIDLNEMLTYLNKSYFRHASDSASIAIIFVFALLASYAALRLPLPAGIAAGALLIAAAFFSGFFLFTKHIIIDAFGPVLLIVTSTVLLHSTRSVFLAFENIMLRKEAVTDGLTGLYAYRYFEVQLRRELAKTARPRRDLALVIYDIDHFKHVNDAYGHEFGNVVLRSIARSLKDHSRKSNVIARYGGEEFCIIITGMDRDHAVKYAERLRNLVGLTEFRTDKGETVNITMSGGIAMAEDAKPSNPAEFVKAADSALYKSKEAGRNRLTVYS
jgi:diguanylate cyclase (GGDEF)-like protein